MIPPIHAGSPELAVPSWSVTTVDGIEGLAQHVPAWDDLAAHAIEPNVFLESWLTLPALRHFGRDALRFALVYGPHPRFAGRSRLCGFFPLLRRRGYRRLPVQTLELWSHPFSLVNTPLLRTGAAPECLRAFFAWAGRQAALVHFERITADGPFYHALIDHLASEPRPFLVVESSTRALLRPGLDASSYRERALSATQRKSLRRKARRLAERGSIAYRFLGPRDNAEPWIESFICLEAAGWKGRAGTALAHKPHHASLFRIVAREAHRRGRLGVFALCLDGRPIAAQCYALAGDGAFALRTAYDEHYARYSPGLLLQAELMQRLAPTGARWLDSNSEPDGFLNSVWSERRLCQTMLVAASATLGPLVIGLLPMLRWLKWTILGRPAGEST